MIIFRPFLGVSMKEDMKYCKEFEHLGDMFEYLAETHDDFTIGDICIIYYGPEPAIGWHDEMYVCVRTDDPENKNVRVVGFCASDYKKPKYMEVESDGNIVQNAKR